MPEENKDLEAKTRVRLELAQLNEKISNLSLFLFSEQSIEKLTKEMRYTMEDQLRAMQEYAKCLLHRLQIWDKLEENPHIKNQI